MLLGWLRQRTSDICRLPAREMRRRFARNHAVRNPITHFSKATQGCVSLRRSFLGPKKGPANQLGLALLPAATTGAIGPAKCQASECPDARTRENKRQDPLFDLQIINRAKGEYRHSFCCGSQFYAGAIHANTIDAGITNADAKRTSTCTLRDATCHASAAVSAGGPERGNAQGRYVAGDR